MRRIAAFLAAIIISVSFAVPGFAYSNTKFVLLDVTDKISSKDEETLKEKAEEVYEATGFNIAVVITDDVGKPKTDSHVEDFCDVTYEEYFGKDTNGALLLINDDTKYDYISTSGSCINYLSDWRIDEIWDDIDKYIASGNYSQAAYNFVCSLEHYYYLGKANNQQEYFGMEIDLSGVGHAVVPALVIALIVTICVYSVNAGKYKLEKPNTAQYILDNSLNFSSKTDTFVGNITTRIYSPRSSGRSGGHGGGHSSTHHSSGGGRHGGGGHHR